MVVIFMVFSSDALNNEVYSSINLLEESDNILPHNKNANTSLNQLR